MQKDAKTPRSRPRVDSETRARILDLHLGGNSMREIERKLNIEGRAVAYNTIRTTVERESPPDPSGPWQLWAYEGMGRAHPELVAPILAAVMTATDGRVRELSNRCADWIAAIRTASPHLFGWSCYVLARKYVAFEIKGRPGAVLDQLVGLTELFVTSGGKFDLTQVIGPDDQDLIALFMMLAFGQVVGVGTAFKVSESEAKGLEDIDGS